MKIITSSWDEGQIVDKAFLDLYTLFWKKTRQAREDLEDELKLKKGISAGAGFLMQLSWKEFVAMFPNDKQNMDKRFEMLEAARIKIYKRFPEPKKTEVPLNE